MLAPNSDSHSHSRTHSRSHFHSLGSLALECPHWRWAETKCPGHLGVSPSCAASRYLGDRRILCGAEPPACRPIGIQFLGRLEATNSAVAVGGHEIALGKLFRRGDKMRVFKSGLREKPWKRKIGLCSAPAPPAQPSDLLDRPGTAAPGGPAKRVEPAPASSGAFCGRRRRAAEAAFCSRVHSKPIRLALRRCGAARLLSSSITQIRPPDVIWKSAHAANTCSANASLRPPSGRRRTSPRDGLASASAQHIMKPLATFALPVGLAKLARARSRARLIYNLGPLGRSMVAQLSPDRARKRRIRAHNGRVPAQSSLVAHFVGHLNPRKRREIDGAGTG